MSDDIMFRAPTVEDSNFILNSWMSELKTQIPYKFIHYKTFNIEQTKIIQSILEKSLVVVACNPEFQDQIYGYIIFEKINHEVVIHYVYVKLLFRDRNIGHQLLTIAHPAFGKDACIITFLPRYVKEKNTLKTLMDHNLFYDPYLLNRRI